jgi:peptidoglycan/xylan/chitin deacetylase (PgdA/CDA1 family)
MSFAVRVAVKFLIKLVAGTLWLPIALLRRPAGARILCYHKVNDTAGNKLSVSTRAFRRQLAYLARHHHVIPLSVLIDTLRADAALPPRSVVITFDDGYRDAFVNAVPILREHGFSATFFITTGLVAEEHPFAHDAGFERFTNRTMRWDEVRQLLEAGMEVGSHGITHRVLAGLDGDAQAKEIVESRIVLEAQLGRRVDAFSYPSGSSADFDATARALVEKAGYTCACTTIDGVNGAGTDRFRLRRSNVLNEDTMLLFRYTMLGAQDWMGVKDSAVGRACQGWFRRVFGY